MSFNKINYDIINYFIGIFIEFVFINFVNVIGMLAKVKNNYIDGEMKKILDIFFYNLLSVRFINLTFFISPSIK